MSASGRALSAVLVGAHQLEHGPHLLGLPRTPRAAASGSASVASGLPPRICRHHRDRRRLGIEHVEAGMVDDRADRFGVAGSRRSVAVIAPSLKPAISGRSRPSASISATTSSASRSKLISSPPECAVLPPPRVSGAITRKCSASVSMCDAYAIGTPVPDRVRRHHAAVQHDQRLALPGLEVVDVDAVGVDLVPSREPPMLRVSCAPPDRSNLAARIKRVRVIGHSPIIGRCAR